MGQWLASPNMKQILLICAVVALVGCGTKNPYWPLSSSPQNKPNLHLVAANIGDPIVEKAIRKELKKPTGELTKADLEKVTKLDLSRNRLTSVKSLEKLTQLKTLTLQYNPDLTKAQIAQLQKALPKCHIYSNPKK